MTHLSNIQVNHNSTLIRVFTVIPFALTFTFVIVGMACTLPVDPGVADEQISIAKVQKEIKIGMSSSDVVEVLGAPNMVTTDDERRETWVYDKVSTQVSSSSSQAGVWLIVAGTNSSNARRTQNQRTLTIIVKFDSSNKVRDFAYRTSSF